MELAFVFPKNLSAITPDDIAALIGSDLRESRTLDYKVKLPGETPEDKKEFLADISSFANTSGGDIIFGLREEDGLPVEVCGLDDSDLDAAILRMDALISSGISPRIRHNSVVISALPLPIIITRIEKSHIGPHRVTLRSHDKFYARTSAGKYSLDVTQLRDSFLSTASISEGIRDFRLGRLASIRAGDTPVPSASTPRLVIHLIPLGAFASSSMFEMDGFYAKPEQVVPMQARFWDFRPNLEGLVIHGTSNSQPDLVNYTHLYRSGIIEAVDSSIITTYQDRQVVSLKAIERAVLRYSVGYLRNQASLGVTPPVYIFLSLLDAEGVYPYIDDIFGLTQDKGYMLDRGLLALPEAEIPDFSVSLDSAMKPVFDILWNSFGFRRSLSYDSEGNYAGAG